jgi:hypothetical protein
VIIVIFIFPIEEVQHLNSVFHLRLGERTVPEIRPKQSPMWDHDPRCGRLIGWIKSASRFCGNSKKSRREIILLSHPNHSLYLAQRQQRSLSTNLHLLHTREASIKPSKPFLVASPLFKMAAAIPPKTTGSTKLDGAIQTLASKEPQKLSGINLYSRFVSMPSPSPHNMH